MSITTLSDVAYQLQQLENQPLTTPEEAEHALDDLQDISTVILTIIDKRTEQMSPKDMALMEVLSDVVYKLQGRILKKTSLGVIGEKMKKVMRKEKIRELR